MGVNLGNKLSFQGKKRTVLTLFFLALEIPFTREPSSPSADLHKKERVRPLAREYQLKMGH
jgi:hypothetical protein